MCRWLFSLALAGSCLSVVGYNASAQQQAKVQIQIAAKPAIMPIRYNPQQMLQADAIVVGRVVGLEPMDVQATPAPNQAKANYRIAVVQISDMVHGLKKD